VGIVDRGGSDLVLILGGAEEKQTVGPGIWLSANNMLWAKENKRKSPRNIRS